MLGELEWPAQAKRGKSFRGQACPAGRGLSGRSRRDLQHPRLGSGWMDIMKARHSPWMAGNRTIVGHYILGNDRCLKSWSREDLIYISKPATELMLLELYSRVGIKYQKIECVGASRRTGSNTGTF